MSDDGILLVAHGKPAYVGEAFICARSIRRFAPDVALALATDLTVPECVWRDAGFTHFVPHDFRDCGGLAFKLRLDRITPFTGATLFIDSDCICYGDLSSVFEAFGQQDFVTLGFPLADCHWFADAEKVRRAIRVREFPFFTGDFYLFRRSAVSEAIFAKAVELEGDYDTLQIHRLGRLMNDEPLMSLAMAATGVQACVQDGGWIMQMQSQGLTRLHLDHSRALATATFCGNRITPKLIHFQTHRSQPIYFREAWRVRHPRPCVCEALASHGVGYWHSARYRFQRRVQRFFK